MKGSGSGRRQLLKLADVFEDPALLTADRDLCLTADDEDTCVSLAHVVLTSEAYQHEFPREFVLPPLQDLKYVIDQYFANVGQVMDTHCR
jgi:hypothetical protein